jgi:hypothetical protein
MSAGCDDGDMRWNPELDDRLAEQLLSGRSVVSDPGDRLLAATLDELRARGGGARPRPGPALQRVFAEGVSEQAQIAGAPATLPRRQAATGRGWRHARLTVRAAGLGLIIKLMLGAAVAAAAVSGVGMSDGSPDATSGSDPLPEPDPSFDLEVLEDLPPGGFGPQGPSPSTPPLSTPSPSTPSLSDDAADGPVSDSSPWAPGRPMELDVPVGPSDPPGRGVAEPAPGDAARDRAPGTGNAPVDREGPPVEAPGGRPDRAPGPPPAAPGPPAGGPGPPPHSDGDGRSTERGPTR